MYSVILAAVLATGGDAPAFGHGCYYYDGNCACSCGWNAFSPHGTCGCACACGCARPAPIVIHNTTIVQPTVHHHHHYITPAPPPAPACYCAAPVRGCYAPPYYR